MHCVFSMKEECAESAALWCCVASIVMMCLKIGKEVGVEAKDEQWLNRR